MVAALKNFRLYLTIQIKYEVESEWSYCFHNKKIVTYLLNTVLSQWRKPVTDGFAKKLSENQLKRPGYRFQGSQSQISFAKSSWLMRTKLVIIIGLMTEGGSWILDSLRE